MKSLLLALLAAASLSACVIAPPRVAYRGPEIRPVEVVPVIVPEHRYWGR
ncbi:hypothetical protein [uncultured Aquitalea sp.]|nr:hypothetical protein [uncultured Aquitalea sp.]